MKLKLRLDDPHTRAVWNAVQRAKDEVASWPDWKRGQMNTPKKPGRPASAYPERYQVRHTPEQMAAWLAAAEREDRTLQNWIRRTLDKAATNRR